MPGQVVASDAFMQIECGMTTVHPSWEPQEGVLPIPGAFVGEIEYELADSE